MWFILCRYDFEVRWKKLIAPFPGSTGIPVFVWGEPRENYDKTAASGSETEYGTYGFKIANYSTTIHDLQFNEHLDDKLIISFSAKTSLILEHTVYWPTRWLPQVKEIFPKCHPFCRFLVFLSAGKQTRERQRSEWRNKKREKTYDCGIENILRKYSYFFSAFTFGSLVHRECNAGCNKCEILLKHLFLSLALPVFSPLTWENFSPFL